ncbi:connexin 32 [Capsaspora owczarzaki ATCC 30864]|uniref:connexin 32 n=1 Tax=Capsaspora owczarzaki (strain ATCC 30864) TaxID=595528 RepID=UPI0003526149|nr:connexin 32 [Capsaspora owczarzaki ATCC 30864]|eukprot:XP_004363676.2 connexin 32 [Capsaspora owczarzaki ATCC 30864]
MSYESMNQKQRKLYDKVKKASGVLNLQKSEVGDAEAQAIAEALKVNTTVLQNNQIGDAGAQAIVESLKVNTTLTELGLQNNQIGDAGAQAIAETLKVNTTLAELALGGNQIGDAGAQAMTEALKVNTTLTVLYLSHNQMTDVGGQAIVGALKVNKTLTSLELKKNFLTNTGITALNETGNTVCKLESLDNQRAPSPADLAQIAARAAANPATEVQQLRSKLAAKDQELAANKQELATKDQELQQLRSDLKSALDRIDVFERNEPPVGSSSNFDGPIPPVSLATLVTATNNFAADSLIGEGAFGRVYSAIMPGTRVAIKKLSAESKQGAAEFKSELDSLSKFRHANIIAILSYAEQGDERCLVYEFMPNGSVRDRLSLKNDRPPLTWSQRHRIAADVSRGMHYVQTAFPDHVLFHLDLKTDNVLLDAYLNAKVSDFGLVRAAQHLDEKSYLRTQTVQGTAVYMCPEFLLEGRMTTKTDVYPFGMILLELVTAAKPGPRLKTDMRKAVKNQKSIEMLDSALKPTEAERQSISEVVTLALECLEDDADDRPSFGRLIASLDA